MVKPANFYGDIIQRVKQEFAVPVFAYQVSGEYTMITAGAKQGGMDLDKAILESLIALRRAGADSILTYFAPKIARLL
jgi:porphobilinogen synthase